MSRRPRRTHSPSFKAKVAIAVMRGDSTLEAGFCVEAAEARKGIADYLRYFNQGRPHQGLDNRTPRRRIL